MLIDIPDAVIEVIKERDKAYKEASQQPILTEDAEKALARKWDKLSGLCTSEVMKHVDNESMPIDVDISLK